jgi:ABC-type multidrug transport system fused ATPase/permease subunit
MNRHQKLVLIAGLFAILAMGIFPPWIRSDRDHVQRPAGYSFLLQSPHRAVDDLLANGPVTYQIDVPHLTLVWALIMLLVSLVVLYLKPERTRRTARVVALRRT